MMKKILAVTVLVSFTGKELHASQGGPDRPTHNEFEAVIDALTGEPLMGFSYR